MRPQELTGRVGTWVDARPAWVRWLAVLGLLGILSVTLVGSYLPERTALSRADEYVYIDAVDKASRGEITRQGAQIDEYSLDLIACRGIELHGPMGERCGGPYVIETFPYRGGITSADIHSPVYYFVTAWLAQAVLAVTPLQELLVAARATGALWLALGLTATVALARALGASRIAAGAVALVVLASPAVRWTSIYITPDALNLLAGSMIALAGLQYARGRWSPGWLIAFSAVAAAVKAQNLFASALVALLLVLLAVTVPEGRSWRRTGRFTAVAVGAVAASLATQVGYSVLRAAWAVAPAPEMDTEVPLRWPVVFRQARAFLMNVTAGPDATFQAALELQRPSTWAIFISWVVAAAVIAGALLAVRLTTEQTRFAQATALSLVLAGPLMYLTMFVVTGRGFNLPDRYGMVMLPAMVAVLAVLAQRRWVQVLLLVLALGGYLEALATFRMV